MIQENKIFMLVDIEKIDEPDNPLRSGMDNEEFKDLVQSIKDVGLLQPITVKKKSGRFKVVIGHRRLLASREAKVRKMPCMVTPSDIDNDDAMKIHENSMREDTAPLDEAQFYFNIAEKNDWSHLQVADKVKRSESYVRQRIEMLTYDQRILDALDKKQISITVARHLCQFDTEDGLATHLDWAITSGATERTVQNWLAQYKQMKLNDDYMAEHVPVSEDEKPAPIDQSCTCHFCQEQKQWNETKLVRICAKCESA